VICCLFISIQNSKILIPLKFICNFTPDSSAKLLMENLIYILIGIAWVAYSVYTARQKAIQKQQGTGMPPRGPSQSSPLPIPGNQSEGKTLFEDIFRELTGEPKPYQKEMKPVIPVTTSTPHKPVHQKNVSEHNVAYEGYTNYKFASGMPPKSALTDTGNDINTQEKYVQIANDESFTKNFNLREAVIFSELLNRKYF
jgi:hypothetical protein